MAADASVIKNRIESLRKKMSRETQHRPAADICLITTGDHHGSEYIPDHFKVREFFSGFTGSAGTMIISADEAWLFTDGRYFIQAEKELEDTGIKLMKSGTEGVPDAIDFLKEQAALIAGEKAKPAVIVCDAGTVSAGTGEDIASCENISFYGDFDPAVDIWTGRPQPEASEIFILDEEKYAGEKAGSKLGRIREKMARKGCSSHIMASLDNIAWTLNLRASDIECTPVFTAFLWISHESAVLFTDTSRVSEKVNAFLGGYGVSVREYEDFYTFLQDRLYEKKKYSGEAGDICEGSAGSLEKKSLMYDKKSISYKIFELIKKAPGQPVKEDTDPAGLFKAVKNPVETENLSRVHIDDGLCVFRLMRHVKEGIKNGEMLTERSVASYVDSLRSKIPDFKEVSFPTISAFGANAAMMHYSATEETDANIEPGGMLLVDSGGQYLRGTTDITRTFAVGDVNGEMKKAYTLTLKGAMALSDAVFLEGCSGYSLDILARQPLWKEYIDYRCGTGHGVGYMLGVHEGPNAFRWKYIPGVSGIVSLQPGMVTTDEPGVYADGKYGVRFENELLCEEDRINEYGRFLRFRILTVAPSDPDLIDTKWLDPPDIERINRYNGFVYDTLAPLVTQDELPALKEYTRKIRV